MLDPGSWILSKDPESRVWELTRKTDWGLGNDLEGLPINCLALPGNLPNPTQSSYKIQVPALEKVKKYSYIEWAHMGPGPNRANRAKSNTN